MLSVHKVLFAAALLMLIIDDINNVAKEFINKPYILHNIEIKWLDS